MKHHQWIKTNPGEERPTPQKPLKPPIHWLPTGEQLADILTKQLKADDWWETVAKGFLSLPLKGMQRA